jgi:hypothetical protein
MLGITTRRYKPISAMNGPHMRWSSVKSLPSIWPWLPGACGSSIRMLYDWILVCLYQSRNNEPIDAMDDQHVSPGLCRYDWFKFM